MVKNEILLLYLEFLIVVVIIFVLSACFKVIQNRQEITRARTVWGIKHCAALLGFFCLQLIGFWFYVASETKSTQHQSCIVTEPCVLSGLRGRKHTQSHTSHASAAFRWKRFVYESA
jgi:hypothetical protein